MLFRTAGITPFFIRLGVLAGLSLHIDPTRVRSKENVKMLILMELIYI